MISTRKKRQQNKKLFSQLSERGTYFMIVQSNKDEQTNSRDNMICRGTSSDNINNPIQVNYPQLDVHTIEENIISKVRSEVEKVLTSVETRVQDAVLTAVENFVIPRLDLAMKSAIAPSGGSVDGNVMEPDQMDFLGNIEGLRMTAFSRINTHTDLKKIDETRGNITVGEGDLLVNENNTDR